MISSVAVVFILIYCFKRFKIYDRLVKYFQDYEYDYLSKEYSEIDRLNQKIEDLHSQQKILLDQEKLIKKIQENKEADLERAKAYRKKYIANYKKEKKIKENILIDQKKLQIIIEYLENNI